MPRSRGRTGRPWRRATAHIRRTQNICHLCGHPIDKTLPATHPESFTVDHILPITHNPDLALRRDNLAAAHKRCNSSKGNGDGHHLTNQRNSQEW